MEEGSLLASAQSVKHVTSLVYSSFLSKTGELLDTLLVSNKAGEIFAYKLPGMDRNVKIAGHTASIVIDMVMSPCGSRLVTCDRDEKIRLSNFPCTDIIESYCLEHKSVVSSIAFSNIGDAEVLLSCGWDYKLCVWDFVTSELLHKQIISSNSNRNGISTNNHNCGTKDDDNQDLQPENMTHEMDNTSADDDDIVEVAGRGEENEKGYDLDDDEADKDDPFPIKIVATRITGLVVAIFRMSPVAQVYHFRKKIHSNTTTCFQDRGNGTDQNDSLDAEATVSGSKSLHSTPRSTSDTSTQFEVIELGALVLKAVPLDVILSDPNHDPSAASAAAVDAHTGPSAPLLIFRLPAPDYLQVFRITGPSPSVEATGNLKDVLVDLASLNANALSSVRTVCHQLGEGWSL